VVLAPASSLVGVPKGISDETAAAVMLQGMTAHYLVHGTRETKPGDTALVHAAAGGTGLLLVQTLKRAGATVFGTCSTDEKAKLARQAGCDHVIRYTEEDVVEEVRSRTDGRGVDVVYDSVGQATIDASLRSLRPRGLLALFGQSSGVVPPIEPYRLNILGSLFLTRPTLAHYTATREELEMRADAVLDAVADGGLQVHIGARYGLDQVADAHRALESRSTTGKLLLIP
jgi:NADPH2:quinone reductase